MTKNRKGIDFSIPHTIISYSELFKWDTCQRQYYYGFGLGLRPQEENGSINTGVKGHRLLQDFYNLLGEGHSKEEALEIIRGSASKLIKSESITEIGPLLKAWTLVDNYIQTTDFTSEAVIVENRFLFPLSMVAPESYLLAYPELAYVQIGFTPDVVFERTGDIVDVEDAKFVARAWSKSKLERFPQAKLYQIFLRRMGYNVSRSIVRFFNVTTGKINEQTYTLSVAEENTLIHDFIEGVLEVLMYRKLDDESKKSARRTMNYTACQFCPYEYICTLEAEGKDATKTMQSQFVKSDYDYTR